MNTLIILSFLIITITGYVLYFISKNRTISRVGYWCGLVFSMCFTTSASSLNVTEKWVVKPVEIIYNDRVLAVDDGENLWELNREDKSIAIQKDTKFSFLVTKNFWSTTKIEQVKMIYTKEK
jgi:hypothetical protein